MTENDYSITPLPNLPNVTGLNPAKGTDSRQKRRNARKRPAQKPQLVNEEIDYNDAVNDQEQDPGDSPDQHIDYCA